MNSVENRNPININNSSKFDDEIYLHKISNLSILDDVVELFVKDHQLSNFLNKMITFRIVKHIIIKKIILIHIKQLL